jgi:alpha-L-fucosidase
VADYLNANAKAHQGNQQAVVTTGSLLPYRERGMSPTLQEKPWLDVSSLSGWFYMNHNPHADTHSNIKDAPTVIHTLADVVSKNGNLLINFPQRGDGSLYPECEHVLDELAKWMPANGEAIFETRPWTNCGEGPTQLEPKGMNELMQPMTWKDIRFTQSKDGKTLYAIVCGIPQGPLTISSLGSVADKIQAVNLLGSTENVSWQASRNGFVIQPSPTWPCAHAVVYRISMKDLSPGPSSATTWNVGTKAP